MICKAYLTGRHWKTGPTSSSVDILCCICSDSDVELPFFQSRCIVCSLFPLYFVQVGICVVKSALLVNPKLPF